MSKLSYISSSILIFSFIGFLSFCSSEKSYTVNHIDRVGAPPSFPEITQAPGLFYALPKTKLRVGLIVKTSETKASFLLKGCTSDELKDAIAPSGCKTTLSIDDFVAEPPKSQVIKAIFSHTTVADMDQVYKITLNKNARRGINLTVNNQLALTAGSSTLGKDVVQTVQLAASLVSAATNIGGAITGLELLALMSPDGGGASACNPIGKVMLTRLAKMQCQLMTNAESQMSSCKTCDSRAALITMRDELLNALKNKPVTSFDTIWSDINIEASDETALTNTGANLKATGYENLSQIESDPNYSVYFKVTNDFKVRHKNLNTVSQEKLDDGDGIRYRIPVQVTARVEIKYKKNGAGSEKIVSIPFALQIPQWGAIATAPNLKFKRKSTTTFTMDPTTGMLLSYGITSTDIDGEKLAGAIKNADTSVSDLIKGLKPEKEDPEAKQKEAESSLTHQINMILLQSKLDSLQKANSR